MMDKAIDWNLQMSQSSLSHSHVDILQGFEDRVIGLNQKSLGFNQDILQFDSF